MVSITDFIQSTTDQKDWDYKESLQLSNNEVHTAPHDLLLQNEGDLANGVINVEVVLTRVFFGIFSNLVAKYFDSGDIKLMFNTVVSSAAVVQSFYQRLCAILGTGTTCDDQFASFNDFQKVSNLASGVFGDDSDELLHVWLSGDFTYTLNYKIDPWSQLVFSLSHRAKPVDDVAIRNQTLLAITKHAIADIIKQEELNAAPFYEKGQLKFTDYTFILDPPELGIFDRVKVRIFGPDRAIRQGQYHVIYFCKFEIDTADAIKICDTIVKIYGPDNHRDTALAPHEVDLIEAGRFWSGRNWWMTKENKLHDFDDPESSIAYWILLNANPDEEGFSLHVTGYDQMIEITNGL